MNNSVDSLRRAFNIGHSDMLKLMKSCGIPGNKTILTQQETDRLYDEWLEDSMNDTERKSGKNRKKIILIDTCSLLKLPASKIFLRDKAPGLLREGCKIIIPLAVINELKRLHKISSDNLKLRIETQDVLKFLNECINRGTVEVYGSDSDGNFVDNLFHQLTAMFALKYDIIVITQDYQLGQDLLTMGNMKSVGHRKIKVLKFDSAGNLLKVSWDKGEFA